MEVNKQSLNGHPMVTQSGQALEGFEDWGIIQEEEEKNGLDPESLEYYFDLVK